MSRLQTSLRWTLSLAVAATVLLGLQPRVAGQAARPNVVVILIDDIAPGDYTTLKAAGLLPNLEALANESYEFRNAFAVGALGSTARASFLTGRYPHNHGEIGSEPWIGEAPKFNQSSTIATWLQNAGYATSLVGRHTTGYGYATSLAAPPGWHFWAGMVDPYTWSVSQYRFSLNGTLFDFAPFNTPNFLYHSTDTVASLGAYFVRNAPATAPFFLMVTPPVYNREIGVGPDVTNECPNPADPFFGGSFWGVTQRPANKYKDTIYGNPQFALPRPPNFNEQDLSDKPLWLQDFHSMRDEDIDCRERSRWRRLENMRSIDDLVGTVVNELKARGVWDNTILIFSADNGLADGEHRYPDKVAPYEEILRVPLLIRTRSKTKLTIDGMALTTDMAPTIAALTGAVPTHLVDGRSLVPLMQNPATPWRKVALFEHVHHGAMVPPTYNALRSNGPMPRKFVHYPGITAGARGEYYDLFADPYELDNLYTDPTRQSQVAVYQAWLAALTVCNKPGGWSCTLLENLFTPPQ